MNQFDLFGEASSSSPPTTAADGNGDTPQSNGNGRKRVSSKRRSPVTTRMVKNFILDTNVLLHDPNSITRFEDNHVWIPVDVLTELDRFKNEQSERGANARIVHRTLRKFFAGNEGNITEGVETAGGGSLRLVTYDPKPGRQMSASLKRFHRIFPDAQRVDHRIIACVLSIQDRDPTPAILVTKDLNMQLKAMAIGVPCQDYLNDKVEARDVEDYEMSRVELHPHEMQRFASTGKIALNGDRGGALLVNQYVLLQSESRGTIPARFTGEGLLRKLIVPDSLRVIGGGGIRPVNLGQQCLVDALLDPEISMVTCYGQAGTGKTLLAVAAGLHGVLTREYTGLTVSRPIVAMGDTLGFLPGTLNEKMRPWLQPIYDALDLLMPMPTLGRTKGRKQGRKPEADRELAVRVAAVSPGIRKPYETLIEQGILEIEALCYIRGRSIPRRFFVLDEAQQLTPLEAKTVITRMSRGSKLVMVGDPGQIDNPYVDSRSNGLVYARNRLKGQGVTAHVSLSKGERSPLAEIGARLM